MKKFLCCLGLVLAGWMILPRASAGLANHALDVYWNDVEGGGSTLIVTPDGESILIDAGSPGTRDAGRIAHTAALAGLKRIDFFILTHFHLDHFGGAPQLSTLLPIGQVYDRGIPDRDPDHGNDAIWIKVSAAYRAFAAAGRNRVAPGL